MRHSIWIAIVVMAGVPALTLGLSAADQEDPAGEGAMVGLATIYESLADSILANKRSERAVVMAILGVSRDRALADLGQAAAGAPAAASGDLRAAATRIGEFATEGGAVIEPIRNRLLQGGHHHHAADSGPEAIYDSGYVVLTKAAKLEALELAKRCAKLAAQPEAQAADIVSVRDAFSALAARSLDQR